ncbi:J domain-containing protein [Myxosarcina sp. GI1]|uniref:J domain-containing protein n=1 Tax=Myxosarcina sp. GI1 TaxID=1541065 RepID=UPI00055D9AF5|nr:J domain-containing protein [Myxosarcina sp. GI1]
MSFAIENGLFKLKITDYHAILAVSLDADAKQIRLRYLKIAQKLHPDTCKSNKQLASEILSKLVNPAYEKLSRQNTFAEHQIVLTQLGKRLAEKKDQIAISNEFAKELAQANDKLETIYDRHLKSLAAKQYESLEQVSENIALLSELNLVYLMLKCERDVSREEKVKRQQPKPSASQPAPTKIQKNPTQSPTEETTAESIVDSYLRRAKQYLEKNSILEAIAELRDALKIEPQNSSIHALLGKAYLQQRQLTMAKVHINKACQANPKDPVALESKKELEKLTKNTDKSKSTNPNLKNKSDSSNSNGFFGGLFGSKKK